MGADVKSYIVQYDIQANTGDAINKLRNIAQIVTEAQEPMKMFAQSTREAASALASLRGNTTIAFKPSINAEQFKGQLDALVVDVERAAAKMRQILYEGLTAAPKSQVQSSARATVNGRTSAQIQGRIKALEDEIRTYNTHTDKANGTSTKVKGLIQQATTAEQKADLQQKLEQRKKLLTQEKAALKVAKELENAQAKQSALIAKTEKQAKATTKGAVPLSTDNAQVLTAWNKIFGKSKTHTLTLNAQVQTALEAIASVQTALTGLTKVATFEIAPTLNTAACAQVEAKLNELAGLSAKVMAPFAGGKGTTTTAKPLTKKQNEQLNQAREQIKALNTQIAATQQNLDKNKAVQNPSRGIKGQITKDTKKLDNLKTQKAEQESIVAALSPKATASTQAQTAITQVQAAVKNAKPVTLPVNVKILASQVKESLSNITRPTLPVWIKPMLQKGAEAKEQFAKLSEKVPPINLVLNTGEAVVALEGFLAKIKAASPQNIVLTASSAGTVAAGSTSTTAATAAGATGAAGAAAVAASKANKGTGKGTAISQSGNKPVTAEQAVMQTQQALKKSGVIPSSFATRLSDWEKMRAGQLAGMRDDAVMAFRDSSPYEQRFSMPTTAGTGTKQVVWGNQMPSTAAPTGYHWTRADISSRLGAPHLAGYKDAQNALRQAQENYNTTNARVTQIDRSIARVQSIRSQLLAQQEPLRAQLAEIERLKQPLLAMKKLNKNQSRTLQRMNETQSVLEERLSAHSSIARIARIDNEVLPRLNAQRTEWAESTSRHQGAVRAASQRLSGYTDGWALTPNNPKSVKGTPSAWAVNRAAELRAQYHNAVLPFANSQEQMKILTDYRRFFKRAAVTTGITPTPGMPTGMMSQYLNEVAAQMRAANVPIPMGLQKYVNKVNGGGGGKVTTTKAMAAPAFDKKLRKWAYPFTGATSFGVRTPMAVEMAKGMGVMYAIGGAMSAISNSFSQAMEYQNTMKTTQAILEHGTDTYSISNFKNMERTVREVGVKTKFSAPEVANAAKFLAMAGQDIPQIEAAIRPIADLALIGDHDLGETADKMTNVMTIFGLKPGQMRAAANVMATTATRSNTDLMMLAESATYGGPVANMYGRKDPNLFADTIAMFGVLGNAGIQASSAGTGLRMMYQNIFNGTKKQKAILDKYGIKRTNEDGSFRSMFEVLKDIAALGDNEVPKIVSQLFRITAQPSANTLLMSLVGGDVNAANDAAEAYDKMLDIIEGKDKKTSLSTLISLMEANRASVNGNISGEIAEEKQNTIQGLWAQVTSTFTEGIVQAFEQRQGGFADMLKGLRDYLAKPETIQMLQNLLDMIVEIGKALAFFVEIWAKLYSAAPGLIKTWVVLQMCFTQLGALMAPFVALISAFSRLGGVLARLFGITSFGAAAVQNAAVGRAVSASEAAMYAPLVIGSKKGVERQVKGRLAARTRQQLTDNAMIAASMMVPGNVSTFGNTKVAGVSSARNAWVVPGNVAATKANLDKGTMAHARIVSDRARKIYSAKNAWKNRVKPAFGRGFTNMVNLGMMMPWSKATFRSIGYGFNKILAGLWGGLGKALGLLVNPITLTVGGLAALGFSIYKFKQHLDGATEAQIRARKVVADAGQQTVSNLTNKAQWYTNALQEGHPEKIRVISSSNPAAREQLADQRKQTRNNFKLLYTDLTKDASKQSVQDAADKWREVIGANTLYQIALGEHKDEYLGAALTDWKHGAPETERLEKRAELVHGLVSPTDYLSAFVEDLWNRDKNHARELQDKMVRSALMMEGANDPAVKSGIARLMEVQKNIIAKTINPETNKPYTQNDYILEGIKVRQELSNSFTSKLSSDKLTLQQYQNSDVHQLYDLYQEGALNVLDAVIRQEAGTPTAVIQGQEAMKQKMSILSDEWRAAVASVASGFRIFDEFTSDDGQIKSQVDLMMNILPDGRIDLSSLNYQISEKVGAFHLTLQQFTDIAATLYTALGKVLSEDELYNELCRQNEHMTIDAKTAHQYYQEHIANHPGNRWYDSGVTEQAYVNFVTSPQMRRRKFLDQSSTTNAEERVVMRRVSARTTSHAAHEKAKASGDKPNNKSTNTTPVPNPSNSTATPEAATQDAYASHYDTAAAKPTVVNINIGEVAHFDRTAIASSAQEKDIIRQMEPLMAECVLRTFMPALNNIQNNFSA